MSSSRLFFALWPDETTRAGLAAAAEEVAPGLGRKVPARNLHITLVFLGQIDDARRDHLIRDADRITGRPFRLEFTSAGWWPGPKVAWLAPDAVPPELAPLVGQLEAAATAAGVEVEGRPYSPHLTIARKVFRRPRPRVFAPIHWEIREFCLVESHAGRSGSEYQLLRRWPLTPP